MFQSHFLLYLTQFRQIAKSISFSQFFLKNSSLLYDTQIQKLSLPEKIQSIE